jgi:hypothetical protein
MNNSDKESAVKILHLLKSEPEGDTRQLVEALSEGCEASEVSLSAGPVDYGELVARVFENDQVVCWW